jgi:hypothetical protein
MFRSGYLQHKRQFFPVAGMRSLKERSLYLSARVYAERTAGICESKAGKLEPASPAGRSV